jgi:sec-independent protein translocase protein TatB
MFDIGWTELLVIGVVALIVVGPKDLPGMFRTLGQFTAKMRRMARDFQRAMDEAADESGVKQTAADLKSMTSAKNMGLNTLKDAANRFDKWEPPKAVKPAAPASAAGSTPAPAPSSAMGPNTVALKENQALEAQKRIAEARAAREAKAAAAAAAAKPAPDPVRFVPREKPGMPTSAAARPKNMPRRKPGSGRT